MGLLALPFAEADGGLAASCFPVSFEAGYNILILSDRGVDATHAPIPSLLATAGVHHHLVREGTRTRVIDLPGDDRVIKVIKFKYRNLPGGGKAKVQVRCSPARSTAASSRND